jgi:hypothetical protein
MHYSFDDSSIQDLGKFETCVSEASYFADRVMALVPTDMGAAPLEGRHAAIGITPSA